MQPFMMLWLILYDQSNTDYTQIDFEKLLMTEQKIFL